MESISISAFTWFLHFSCSVFGSWLIEAYSRIRQLSFIYIETCIYIYKRIHPFFENFVAASSLNYGHWIAENLRALWDEPKEGFWALSSKPLKTKMAYKGRQSYALYIFTVNLTVDFNGKYLSPFFTGKNYRFRRQLHLDGICPYILEALTFQKYLPTIFLGKYCRLVFACNFTGITGKY